MGRIEREWWAEANDGVSQNRWLHVYGPPHYGKSTFLEALRDNLGKQANARIVTVEAEGGISALLHASGSPARQDEDSNLWCALSEVAAREPGHLYVIVDDIDPWLLSEDAWDSWVTGFRAEWAGLNAKLHLVTTAAFSVQALSAFTDTIGGGMPKGFLEMTASGIPFPGEDYADEELRRLAARLDPLKFEGRQRAIVETVVRETDGHPGLVLDLLDAIAAGERPASQRTFVDTAVRTGIDRIRGYEQKLLDDLFPWRDSTRIRTARHAEVVSAALQYFLLDPSGAGVTPACAVSFCRSLGLVMQEAVDLAEQATRKPAKGLSFKVPYLNWVPFGDVDRLHYTLDYFRGERAPDLRLQESRRKQADDKHVKLVRDLAEEYFCKTERGRARQTAIEGECKAIIDGRYYSLTLASHQEYVVTAAEARGETAANGEKVVRDTLRIFLGVPEKIRDLWQRDFAILRQISDTGNDALPDIREQGTLADIVTEEEPFGFILLQNEGHEINDAVRAYYRAPENRSRVVHEVRRMVQALVDLQKQGIVHRLINRSTLRWHEIGGHVQLRLGGFELVTSAYTHDRLRDDKDEAAQIKMVTAQRLAELVGMKRNRIFCEPAAQYFFCVEDGEPASGEVEKTSYMPQTDVFALCMTLCDLFLGPPREADLKAFEMAEDGHEAVEALKELLQNYKADIVAATSDIVTPTLRDILLSGLETDTASRPTAIEISAEMVRKAKELYLEYSPQANTTYILTYDARNTLNELGRNLRHLLGFDPEDREAPSKLQEFLQAQLRSATHIFRDPDGFGRFVPDTSRRTMRQDKATVVISCQQGLNFYCDLAGEEYGLPYSNGRVLMLRYSLDRRNHALSRLVGKRARIEFPSTAFRLVPSDNAHIADNQLDNLARDESRCGNWRELLSDLVDPKVPVPLQAAYDAMQFVTEIELQERLLIHFPVKVQKSVDSGHFCRIALDTERFNRKSDRDPYKSLLLLDARMKTETFFQIKILEWLEKQSNASDERVLFRKTGTDFTVSLPIQPNDVRPGFILIRSPLRDLEGEGELRFADDHGIRSLYAARQAALARLRDNDDVLAQLDSPHPTMALSRTRPDKFGEGLKGRARDIIWSMIDAHPLFLLQGPPGTGKTRALSEAIFHVLAKEEQNAKFLVSAQSHASVDTTLQRIAQTFREKLSEEVGERFHMIRYMPAVDKERVNASVRDNFGLDSVVARVARRMRSKADEELDRMSPRSGDEPRWQAMRRAALTLLRNASNESFDEIERRVQRNASVHFTTSSSVRDDTIGMFGMEGKFHTAVVEEAAKVWGAGIIQPLIMARKGILIGDHKQIGPFDSERYNRLAIMACGGDPTDGLSRYRATDADPIFPQYRDEPMAMVNWLETFRRIFERYESGVLEQKQNGVRMADTLDTQFRSTREIGELVSHAFYDRKVVYGEAPHDMERRLINTEAFGAREGSLLWLNTQNLDSSHHHMPRGDGRIENAGEARILQRLLSRFRRRDRIVDPEEPDIPISERLLILSPYRSQIQKISQFLTDDPGRYGFSRNREEALAQISSCCTSIDAAQGMEADTVIVSCVRSVSADDRDYPSRESFADAAEWNLVMRRNFGFMTEPERINVMFSRARLQLVCIGNFDHFDSIAGVVEDWAKAHGSGSPQATEIQQQQGFWARLTGYLKDQDGAIVDLKRGGDTGLV